MLWQCFQKFSTIQENGFVEWQNADPGLEISSRVCDLGGVRRDHVGETNTIRKNRKKQPAYGIPFRRGKCRAGEPASALEL